MVHFGFCTQLLAVLFKINGFCPPKNITCGHFYTIYHTIFSDSTVSANVTTPSRTQRSVEDVDNTGDDLEEEEDEDVYVQSLTGETKCKTKFWRCVAKVVKNGAHLVEGPGGLTGYAATCFVVTFSNIYRNLPPFQTVPEDHVPHGFPRRIRQRLERSHDHP